MAEWFKAAVLKTARGQLLVGSNPTPSARSKSLADPEYPEVIEIAQLVHPERPSRATSLTN